MRAPFADRLLPRELIGRLLATRASEVALSFPAPWLLLPVDGPTSALAVGLLEDAAPDDAPPSAALEALGFATKLTTRDRVEAWAAARAARGAWTATRLRSELSAGTFVAVPLVKRAGTAKPFAGRVSVGRARNNDVVLRDESVSKFHAWFEVDDDDELHVFEARSKNRTRLNGCELLAGESQAVGPGDELQFGSVRATLTLPSTVHAALRAAPP